VLAAFATANPGDALAGVARDELGHLTFQKADMIEGVLREALGCAAPWQDAANSLSVISGTLGDG